MLRRDEHSASPQSGNAAKRSANTDYPQRRDETQRLIWQELNAIRVSSPHSGRIIEQFTVCSDDEIIAVL